MLPNGRAHLIAIREVLRKQSDLNIDMTRQVDIFSIINELKIPLAFQPLKNLSGAFIPAIPSANITAGILINENHPKSRQRYTAAHELCHYFRDNEASFDIETEIIARDQLNKYHDREQIAEAFAAWFLMPEDLVNYQSDFLGINFFNSNPVDIYQLSLLLGTSYSATINHLYSMKKIRWSTREKLLSIAPREIKSKILNNSKSLGWNDVWIIDEKSNNHNIYVQIGDEIKINLKETPSTGYLWCFESECPSLEIKEDYHENFESERIGAIGKRFFVLATKEEGICNIACSSRRPWIKKQLQGNKFSLSINIEGKRHGINIKYLN